MGEPESPDLTGVHIPKADLTFADLREARLNGADLNGAHLRGADLTNAQHLTQDQLDKDCGTGVKGLDKLSPPLTIKPCTRVLGGPPVSIPWWRWWFR
jgi:hypothetical protein